MKEAEAIEWLKAWSATHQSENDSVREAIWSAIRALEEVQQYRSIIGLTPEDLKALEKDEIQTIGDALKAFAAWSQYKEIGTVEEFRQLKERGI